MLVKLDKMSIVVIPHPQWHLDSKSLIASSFSGSPSGAFCPQVRRSFCVVCCCFFLWQPQKKTENVCFLAKGVGVRVDIHTPMLNVWYIYLQFTPKTTQMSVNRPYIEHLGYIYIYIHGIYIYIHILYKCEKGFLLFNWLVGQNRCMCLVCLAP